MFSWFTQRNNQNTEKSKCFIKNTKKNGFLRQIINTFMRLIKNAFVRFWPATDNKHQKILKTLQSGFEKHQIQHDMG